MKTKSVVNKGVFSKRELEIIKHLQTGKRSREIAEILNISKHTVDTHRRKIIKKAQCRSTLQLVAILKE